MHDRSRFLVAHGVDPVQWAARYGLEPFTHPCYRCNEPATTSIPFALATLRGLAAPECACGHPTPPYCVVSTVGNDLADLFPVLPKKRRGKR
jgi:hypothetical protein